MMKKVLFSICLLAFGLCAMAQQSIQMRSANRAECTRSDMTRLEATFSFSGLNAQNVETTRGAFSEIQIEGTYPNGNVGEPQLPMFTRLIAIPTGATPFVTVGAHSETEFTLSDYNIGKVSPMQAPIRKSVDPSTVEYAYSEAAYTRNSYNDDPIAMVEVLGTMRGITLGRLIVQPVRYNPVAGTVKVYNDIEVSVDFQNGDASSTADMFSKTFSPAFRSVYDQIFNIDMLMNGSNRDAYTDHPDMYNTPVKMLVICYSGFQGNAALNSWLEWKLQKGYYVDIFYTNETGTDATSIKNFIKTKYNASVSAGNAYTYLIVIGDTGQVPQYMTKYIDSTAGNCASDLGYASVNFTTSSTTNYFPDMYYSRISVENTTHLTNYMNKVLTYEKYGFTDGGNYLNNVVLVGGWDSSWTARVAKPTINYATNNYFNSSNTTYGGFSGGTINATISTSSTQGWSGTNNGCYNGLNNGVCFLNYTAHGDKQEWQGPQFTAAQVATLSNTGKYFFGVGNCCLTGNFNNTSTSYSPGSAIGTNACFAETMIRVPNAGAIAYVGCSPYSYWYEDFYWAVGAHSYSAGNAPSVSSSTKGVYDVMFMDQYWNSASALLYVGNLAVQQAVSNNNTTSSITDGNTNNSAHYYFQFYHCFGDGSVMPYVTKPEANSVTIPSAVTPGTSSVSINAVAGSYVAVTDNSSTIYGVGVANSSGVATVNFTNSIPGSGTLYVVVTRQQYQPYFGTIQIAGGTQYNITVTQPQHGTISAPAQAYANTTVELTAMPDTHYALSSWNVRDASNNSITVTDNKFTMPSSNVTVTATFRALQQHQITYTAQQSHGTISVSPTNAYMGDIVTLTATPNAGFILDQWHVTTGREEIPVVNNQFTMPDSEVNVSATFKAEERDLTVYDGTSTNQYIPMYGYYFDAYTKSECIIPASQLTAMTGGSVSAITFYPSTVATTNDTWSSTSQTVFLKEVSGTTLGGSYSGTSGATTVKQGLLEMPTAGTAYTITFDTPYTYNGGNLLIGIYNTAKGSYNKVEWYGTSNLTSGVSAYGNNSNSLNSVGYNAQSFIPKTTFTYTQSTTPYLSLAPSSATGLVGFTETITATYGNVSGTPNITYTSSNTNVATVTGSGTTATITGVSAGTATITASMTVDGTAYTATCAVTVETPSYCTPSFGSNDDCITNITLGSINNTTASTSTSGYGDYTSMSTELEAGTTATLSLTSGAGSGTHAAAVWIDFDDSYTFESSERVGTQGSISASSTVSISLTIPANATPGSHRMRVVYQYNVTATNIDPCASATYGEGEDYTVVIPAISTDPVEITATANPAEGGTVTGAGTYTPGTQCTLIATANEGYTFANWTKNGVVISTNATYSFNVTTAAAYVANFTLNSYMITAAAEPSEGGTVTVGSRTREDLFYDFEDGTQGWTVLKGTTGDSPNNWHHNTTHVSYSSGTAHDWSSFGHDSSSGFMISESYISATSASGTAYGAVTPDNYLVSPQVRLGGSISFYAGARNTDYCAEKFSVMVSTTNNTNTASFTNVETFILNLSSAGYTSEPYVVDLSAYSGMGYIAIRHWDCYDQWVLCIDDITIVEGSDGSTGNGNFLYGETCVVTATPNEGYYFSNWTENNNVVSSAASYSFTVTGDRDLKANFTQQQINYFSVNVTVNPENAGIISGVGSYQEGSEATLTVSANSGYVFVNWSDGSTENPRSFTVNNDVTLTANFAQTTTQHVVLNAGWNWWAPNAQIDLEDFEDALSNNALSIVAHNGHSDNYNGSWGGNLESLEPGAMYMIEVETACEFDVNGIAVDPADYPITLNPEANWIGFIGSEEKPIAEALINFTPTPMDNIKTATGTATYYRGKGWRGSISTMKPGQGYIYNSKASTPQTFNYPATR